MKQLGRMRFTCIGFLMDASWLNMIELKFSALARAWLSRCIPPREQLVPELLTLVRERHEFGNNVYVYGQTLLTS